MANRKSMKSMFFEGDWSKLRGWEFAPLVFFYVIWFSVRGLVRDRGTVLTGSLAFTSALAVVPLLTIAFWGLLTFGDFNDGAAFAPYLQQLFPASTPKLVGYLAEFASTSASQVAGVGAIAFYVIAFFLFIAAERAFSIIWASDRKRPVAQRLGTYLLIMSFGPLLLSLSFAMTAYAAVRMEQFNIAPGITLVLVPFALAFMAFTAMNHFLPTTRVHAWASILAGAFTAAAFELAKYGFNLYVTELVLVPHNQIYGALGLFPMSLVWLYVIWIVVLFGAKLAYTAQNLRSVVRVEHASKRSGVAGDHVFNPTIGLEMYAPIARAFKRGGGRFTDRDLVALTGYPESVVRAVVAELARIGTIEVVDEDEGERRLIPSKQLDDIELWPMLDTFIDFDTPTDVAPVRDLLNAYRDVSAEVLRGRNALAFVDGVTTISSPRPTERRGASHPSAARPQTIQRPPDDDLFEPPPNAASATPVLDAEPLARARAIADRAKNLRSRPAADAPATAAPNLPDESQHAPEMGDALDLHEAPPALHDASDDPIRIDTQDILVTDDLEDDNAGLDTFPSVAPSERTRKKESSIQIDFDAMWDDFEVDSYDDVLAEASKDSTEKPNVLSDAQKDALKEALSQPKDAPTDGDDPDEKASPPPMPTLKK